MAFYSSDDSYWNNNYAQNSRDHDQNNFLSSQFHMDSSSYYINEPRYYHPPYDTSSYSSYNNQYQYAPSQSLVAYSAIHNNGYYNDKTVSTQSVIYCSVTEPTDDLDFEEYDPDPYSGGYDIAQHYGKPLVPDEKICHPRSSMSGPSLLPVEIVAAGTAESKVDSGSRGAEPEHVQADGNDDHDGDDLSDRGTDVDKSEQFSEDEDEIGSEDELGTDDDDDDQEEEEEEDPPEVDHGDVVTSERSTWAEDEMREYGKKVYNMPPGYGLESLDLCEGLFGYWPCLRKAREASTGGQVNSSHTRDQGGEDVDLWKTTADCLFGNPDPYAGLPGHGSFGFGDTVYAYPMLYNEQPSMYENVEYDDNSWVVRSQ